MLQPLFVLAFPRLYARSGEKSDAGFHSLEPSFKRLMVYLFVAMRGGGNRTKIVELLRREPSNANRIAEVVGLDYKTVRHHLRLLEENEVIVASPKETYGTVYFLSSYVDQHFEALKALWA